MNKEISNSLIVWHNKYLLQIFIIFVEPIIYILLLANNNKAVIFKGILFFPARILCGRLLPVLKKTSVFSS